MTAYDDLTAYRYGNFSPSEWPDPTVLKLVDTRVLAGLNKLRDMHGKALHPSKHPDGWSRTTGSTTSRHYAVGRLSDAGDFFPEGDVLECWLKAIQMPEWGGFGLYLDTKKSIYQPGAMMHLDLRPGPRVFWIRNEIGEYVLKDKEPAKFWNALARVRKK